jgi:hypothetical protein
MPTDSQQVSSLARAVRADIRARLGAERRSGKWLAEQIGLSQNYVAKRLRDEAPFNLDDLAANAEAFWLDSTRGAAARAAREFAPGPDRIQGHSEGAAMRAAREVLEDSRTFASPHPPSMQELRRRRLQADAMPVEEAADARERTGDDDWELR